MISHNSTKLRHWRHFFHAPLALTGAFLTLGIILGALFAPLVAPHNPYDLTTLSLSNRLLPPSWHEKGAKSFPLGTDEQGRCVLSTILYGSRTSLVVSLGVVSCATVIGIVLGLVSGYYGGLIDSLLMRTADILFSFSTMLMAIIVMGVLKRSGIGILILAIVLVDWVRYARTMRSSVLSERSREYVLAARGIGAGVGRLLGHHLLPNAIPPLLVLATVDIPVIIMIEATLSFLGVGVPLTTPSLGLLISSGRQYLYAGKWWLIVFPGAALFVIVLGVNLLGDWLREELNPKLR